MLNIRFFSLILLMIFSFGLCGNAEAEDEIFKDVKIEPLGAMPLSGIQVASPKFSITHVRVPANKKSTWQVWVRGRSTQWVRIYTDPRCDKSCNPQPGYVCVWHIAAANDRAEHSFKLGGWSVFDQCATGGIGEHPVTVTVGHCGKGNNIPNGCSATQIKTVQPYRGCQNNSKLEGAVVFGDDGNSGRLGEKNATVKVYFFSRTGKCS